MHDLKAGVLAALEASRSGAELGRSLGLSRQAVYQWDRVPAERVIDVERLTGVPRTVLRPDLYPPEQTSAPPAEARP